MLSKKITCGVCGYRVTPKREEIYVAEEPRAFVDALTKPPTRFNAMVARVAVARLCWRFALTV